MGGTWATRALSTRFLYADDVRHVPAGDNHQETSYMWEERNAGQVKIFLLTEIKDKYSIIKSKIEMT